MNGKERAAECAHGDISVTDCEEGRLVCWKPCEKGEAPTAFKTFGQQWTLSVEHPPYWSSFHRIRLTAMQPFLIEAEMSVICNGNCITARAGHHAAWEFSQQSISEGVRLCMKQPYPKLSPNKAFSARWAEAYDNPDYADATVDFGGKLLHVSKLVLSLRSGYFRALFAGPYKENDPSSGPVKIADMNPIIGSLCVRWLYDGFLDLSVCEMRHSESMVAAYRIAKRLCIHYLRECLQAQIECVPVTFDNFPTLFHFAVEENLDGLKKRLAKFTVAEAENLGSKQISEQWFNGVDRNDVAGFFVMVANAAKVAPGI